MHSGSISKAYVTYDRNLCSAMPEALLNIPFPAEGGGSHPRGLPFPCDPMRQAPK